MRKRGNKMKTLFDVEISCDGDIHEQITRSQRLYFVLGYAFAINGTLQFINSIHDRKGVLTVDITGHHYALENAIAEAWNNAGESSVHFVRKAPKEPEQWERCKVCDARLFCDNF